MDFINIIIVSALAVGCMTLFTFLVSVILNENFGQPKLITEMINRLRLPYNFTVGISIGWLIHYFIGVGFYIGYIYLKPLFKLGSEFVWALLYGLMAGVIGVLGWHFMFVGHQNPPEITKLKFHLQLVIAHIVFSLTVAFIIIFTDFK